MSKTKAKMSSAKDTKKSTKGIRKTEKSSAEIKSQLESLSVKYQNMELMSQNEAEANIKIKKDLKTDIAVLKMFIKEMDASDSDIIESFKKSELELEEMEAFILDYAKKCSLGK